MASIEDVLQSLCSQTPNDGVGVVAIRHSSGESYLIQGNAASSLRDPSHVEFFNRFVGQRMQIQQYFADHFFRQVNEDGELVLVCGGQSRRWHMLAVHDTTIGPGVGGLREASYQSPHDAVLDVLRLAEGMTYKAVHGHTESGGVKSVRMIIGVDDMRTRAQANLEFGVALAEINRRRIDRGLLPVYAAEDMNTTQRDCDEIAAASGGYAVCKSEGNGGSGNPSPYTALGVAECMRIGARFVFVGKGIEHKWVLVEGVGNCGAEVAKYALENGANVIIADKRKSAVDACHRVMKNYLGDECDMRVVPIVIDEEAFKTDPHVALRNRQFDIYSPCAGGGVLNDISITLLVQAGVRLVCGSANNQLADQRHGQILHNAGIIYLPDYVVNAGGLINAVTELPGRMHLMRDVVHSVHGVARHVERMLHKHGYDRPLFDIIDSEARMILARAEKKNGHAHTREEAA